MAETNTTVGVAEKAAVKPSKAPRFDAVAFLRENLTKEADDVLRIIPISPKCFRCNWLVPVRDERPGRHDKDPNIVTHKVRQSMFVRCSQDEDGKVKLEFPEVQ